MERRAVRTATPGACARLLGASFPYFVALQARSPPSDGWTFATADGGA